MRLVVPDNLIATNFCAWISTDREYIHNTQIREPVSCLVNKWLVSKQPENLSRKIGSYCKNNMVVTLEQSGNCSRKIW